ncbi:extensin-like [Mizuhopecten yessoensis]|uniref:extensin-like n=1 Tax=Mizuhopecten yessoensis TaxID=6573 RepID=UPI000B45775E|nr:extensin-like [Mizuhopecten yessoensis]
MVISDQKHTRKKGYQSVHLHIPGGPDQSLDATCLLPHPSTSPEVQTNPWSLHASSPTPLHPRRSRPTPGAYLPPPPPLHIPRGPDQSLEATCLLPHTSTSLEVQTNPWRLPASSPKPPHPWRSRPMPGGYLPPPPHLHITGGPDQSLEATFFLPHTSTSPEGQTNPWSLHASSPTPLHPRRSRPIPGCYLPPPPPLHIPRGPDQSLEPTCLLPHTSTSPEVQTNPWSLHASSPTPLHPRRSRPIPGGYLPSPPHLHIPGGPDQSLKPTCLLPHTSTSPEVQTNPWRLPASSPTPPHPRKSRPIPEAYLPSPQHLHIPGGPDQSLEATSLLPHTSTSPEVQTNP